MRNDTLVEKALRCLGLVIWGGLIMAPLVVLAGAALMSGEQQESSHNVGVLLLRSGGLAAVVAVMAVLLGRVPARLVGTGGRRGALVLFALLMPLVLPRYVLYYAWTLLLSPTTELGRMLSGSIETARLVGKWVSCLVLILWYWPLAALLMGQGWRNTDRDIWHSASLDARGVSLFGRITLPLLARSMLLAFGVCFVLCLSEFGTFHLGGIATVGTELAVLYQLTGSVGSLMRASWPVAVVALAAAVCLGRVSRSWEGGEIAVAPAESQGPGWRWVVLLVLLTASLGAPLALLMGNINDFTPFRQFLTLHVDELGWSLAVAGVAMGLAYVIGFVAMGSLGSGKVGRWLTGVVRGTVLLAMFLPGSMMASGLVRLLAAAEAPMVIRQGWYIVSAGQAMRLSGIAMIVLLLTRDRGHKLLAGMAAADGASRVKAWWHVHLRHSWGVLVGGGMLMVMVSMTELSATMVLLPAGLGNFAQRLLNQMHYARDQQVIASCVLLICLFVLLAGSVVVLLRSARGRCLAVLLGCILMGAAGCDSNDGVGESAEVVGVFGSTGRGPGEFMYPRAIDISPDGSLFIVDKTGRIQQVSTEGDFISVIKMPQIDAGKPTGLSVAENGDLYVADTHYHRVVVFSPSGEFVREFGKFGEEDGCFIYPTDVAFGGDGRIFVAEYGGNDRISVFDERGEFLYSFGGPDSGEAQLSRPAGLAVDRGRGRLYVADACNHRIAVFDLEGKYIEQFGSVGRGPGELRYPYDLALSRAGEIVVCEFGNNRVQWFAPDGESLGAQGGAGRELGRLAYPWGLALDAENRIFVVDAGNNRVQVWQL